MFIHKNLGRALRFVMMTLVAVAFSVSAWAQNISVTGTVTDVNGEPIIGAYVLVQGTSNGTSTDVDGKYQISVPSNGTLEFTLVGMKDVVVPVNGKAVINAVMEEDSEMLDDVVVVGFGTQKKENLTGAVASVNTSKQLASRPIADVGRGLQGATPGLNVRIGSSDVGADPVMRIRGQYASMQGSAQPLILLDNVEIPSISLINPDDIESISVLKDAASSSIYGAKAAFGVILIQSKKGSKEKERVSVTYSGNFALQNLAEDLDYARVNGMHYTVQAFERTGGVRAGYPWYVSRASYEAAKAWEQQFGNMDPQEPMMYGRDYYYDGSLVYGVRTYDPTDYMVRKNAPTHSHNVSIAGNKGNTDYNISLAYLDQSGMMKPAKHDDYSRYNANVRVSTKINDWLKVNAGLMYSKTNKRWAYNTAVGNADMWYYLYRWGPTIPTILADNNGYELRGPTFESYASNTANNATYYTSATAGATVTPMKNWNINFDYTFAATNGSSVRPGTRFYAGDTWSTPAILTDENGNARMTTNYWAQYNGLPATFEERAFVPDYYTSKGSGIDHIRQSSSAAERHTVNLTTTYDWNLNDNHKFNFMAGMQSVSYESVSHWSQKMELMDYTNPQFNLATGTQTSGGDFAWNSQLGFFGRLNYNFKEKYLLEANIRYDGSSKFPGHMQWKWFPSFSAGWRVTEEPWMEGVKDALTSWKLRASWGSIGDQSVGSSLYIPTMSATTSSWIHNGMKDTYYGTPAAVSADLTWQNIVTLNVGTDITLFNNLNLTFDWFQRDTKDMIVPGAGVGYSFGTTAPQVNTGSLRTRGWEVAVNYGHMFQNGFSISATATLADAVTKITEYGTTQSISSWYVGKTYGEIWGYKVDRLYQNSDFERDANGNLIIIEANDPSNPSDYQYRHYKYSDPNATLQGRFNASNTVMFGPGDVKYKDLDGDGVITPGAGLVGDTGDQTIIGNTTPRYEYSFRVDMEYKGFDLGIFFQGVGKRDMWGSSSVTLPGFNSSDGAMANAFADDFWYETIVDGQVVDANYDAFYPRAYNMGNSTSGFNLLTNDRYLLNMAYLRLKNVTLGYTLPAKLTKKAQVNKLRFYVSLENFLTFDHLDGMPVDPEVIAGSSALTSSYNSSRAGVGAPAFRTTSFGVQLTF